MIVTKRVYEPARAGDGERFLVERLWPRGVKKESLRMATWLKAVAPSTELRQWFGHDPARWNEFRRRYFAELDSSDAARPLLEAARRQDVTLLYSSHDQEHNNAVALKEYVERKLSHRKRVA